MDCYYYLVRSMMPPFNFEDLNLQKMMFNQSQGAKNLDDKAEERLVSVNIIGGSSGKGANDGERKAPSGK